MPWKETCPMEERLKLVRDWLKGNESVKELSVLYNVSRKTAHKWIKRFKSSGAEGLKERSRAPRHHPNGTSREVRARLLDIRRKHPYWGPRKLLVRLAKQEPTIEWPAPSTAGGILKRYGLVRLRGRRRRTPLFRGPYERGTNPNAIWAADFKGWFRTQDGRRIDPLTITDWQSRYLIRCQAVQKTNAREIKEEFEQAFREYGLPQAIRTDNGPPFASVGLGGLTRLSVWWIRLGILPERIRPAHPQDNGRHERMHRSLLQEAAQPPKESFWAQQKEFDTFRQRFNQERPHEALEMKTPSDVYLPSQRVFPNRLPEMIYGDEFSVRRVRSNGEIKWAGEFLFISEALVGEYVALKQTSETSWAVHFGPLCLASFNSVTKRLQRNQR